MVDEDDDRDDEIEEKHRVKRVKLDRFEPIEEEDVMSRSVKDLYASLTTDTLIDDLKLPITDRQVNECLVRRSVLLRDLQSNRSLVDLQSLYQGFFVRIRVQIQPGQAVYRLGVIDHFLSGEPYTAELGAQPQQPQQLTIYLSCVRGDTQRTFRIDQLSDSLSTEHEYKSWLLEQQRAPELVLVQGQVIQLQERCRKQRDHMRRQKREDTNLQLRMKSSNLNATVSRVELQSMLDDARTRGDVELATAIEARIADIDRQHQQQLDRVRRRNESAHDYNQRMQRKAEETLKFQQRAIESGAARHSSAEHDVFVRKHTMLNSSTKSSSSATPAAASTAATSAATPALDEDLVASSVRMLEFESQQLAESSLFANRKQLLESTRQHAAPVASCSLVDRGLYSGTNSTVDADSIGYLLPQSVHLREHVILRLLADAQQSVDLPHQSSLPVSFGPCGDFLSSLTLSRLQNFLLPGRRFGTGKPQSSFVISFDELLRSSRG